MKDEETAERWRAHVLAAAFGAGKDARSLLEGYFAAARTHPDSCPLLDVDGKEEKLAQFRAELSAGETVSVPLPEMPLSHLKTPPLTEERDAYIFQLLSLVTRGGGTIITDIGDGWNITTGRPPDTDSGGDNSDESA